MKQWKDWRKLWRRWAHSPTFSLLHLRHSSFSNPSVALPTSQLILQSFRCFIYVTAHSPILPLLDLRHSSFSNPSFASPATQALHLRHLASRPCFTHQGWLCWCFFSFTWKKFNVLLLIGSGEKYVTHLMQTEIIPSCIFPARWQKWNLNPSNKT